MKFFQIAAAEGKLWALDNLGQVWYYSNNYNDASVWHWKKLPVPDEFEKQKDLAIEIQNLKLERDNLVAALEVVRKEPFERGLDV